MASSPKDIDDYIAGFPPDVQKILRKIRATIRKAAPKAEEAIKYQIPTFVQNGNLIHFAAYKNHIGLYPAPRGVAEFKDELAAYEGGKGTLRFPLDEPIPYDLISRIVKFRVMKDRQNAKVERKKR
jgi:uncharacterized protein YdhG (YjbR/CyaY superfamily)